MRYAELREAKVAPLYHGTSLSSALEILHTGKLWAGTSLSRSHTVAGHFADKTSAKLDDNRHGLTPLGQLEYEADLGTYAIMVFDQAKLMHNVGLAPYNWFYHEHPNDKYERGHEMEEVTKRNASPVERYLVGIESYGFEPFLSLVLEKFPEYAGAVEKFRSLLGHQGVLNRFVKK